MQALFFYLTYPFIYLIALLPFSVLYMLSDLFYHILVLMGYRKEVVLKNLKNSFPEKSLAEIEAIRRAYYQYLCDLILETLKTLTMSEKQARSRCIFHRAEWLDNFYREKRSIIIMMGHYGNWEWAGPGFTLNNPYQLVVVYRPLSNMYFEKMMCGMRTKFGTQITPVDRTLRDMVSNKDRVTATAFIADQTATAQNAYWTTFLNQDTAVFTGPEKLAKKFNYPVVFMNVKRMRRGYYEVYPELLFDNPGMAADNQIAETFTRRLEQEIRLDPAIWLWSHRRWKHVRQRT